MSDELEQQRRQMVDNQVAARGIQDTRILEAMRTVPRHEFIAGKPATEDFVGADLLANAFNDVGHDARAVFCAPPIPISALIGAR